MLILRPSRNHGVYPPNDNFPAFWKDRKGRQPSSLGSEGLGAMMQRKSGSNALLRERAEAHKGMDKAPAPLTAPAEETAADLSAQAGRAHRAEAKRDLEVIAAPATRTQHFSLDDGDDEIEVAGAGGPGPGAPGAGAVAVQDRSYVLHPAAAAAIEERPSLWDRRPQPSWRCTGSGTRRGGSRPTQHWRQCLNRTCPWRCRGCGRRSRESRRPCPRRRPRRKPLITGPPSSQK